MLKKTYGESAMSKTKVYKWYKRFQDGREDVEDDECPGHHTTTTTDENVIEAYNTDQNKMNFFMFSYLP